MTTTLERLAEADLAWREAKLTLKKRIADAMETELHSLKVKRDTLAYEADLEGVPTAHIHKIGLHTSDRNTAYLAITEGSKYSTKAPAATEVVEESEFEQLPEGVIRIRPKAETLAPLLPLLGFEEGGLEPVLEADFVIDEEGRLDPLTPIYTPENGRNPVIALVQGEQPDFRNRALEFAGKVAA